MEESVRVMLMPMSNVVSEVQRLKVSQFQGKDAAELPEESDFGTMHDGTPVRLYTLRRGTLEASFTNFGARLVSLKTPDRGGEVDEIVLGFSSLEQYVADDAYMGAVVGRYGNRIAEGRFSLNGNAYQIPPNNKGNALHGGPVGFDHRVWQAQTIADGVEMTLESADGDQGFPGTLMLIVRYTLRNDALQIEYTATTDETTVINVTNHAYFNLAGESSGSILEHVVMISGDRFTPTDARLIPTGELAHVEGTPFDLREMTRIGSRIGEANEQLQFAGGYDHNWVLGETGEPKLAARVREGRSGRVMTVETTEPGIQFYSGNFLDGSLPNRSGGRYGKHAGLCLETQHYPDSPNQPHFPSVVLNPGETMHSRTTFSFSVEA